MICTKGNHKMSWALHAIQALKEGQIITIQPHGSSMAPKISDRDYVTLAPCDPVTLQHDDIVLVRVHGQDYIHLIKGIKEGQVLVGNNKGHINGWTSIQNVFGKVVEIKRG